MRFAYHHSMCPPEQYTELTLKAEELGFDAVSIPDSICYPKEADPQYPYNADGSREFLEDVPFIEPFILMSYLAAKTEKLHFMTSVHKTAVHEPALIAKAVSSLAVMSNNRFSFGVGISPWFEDFQVANTQWEKRGKRLNEIIEIINGLMSGEYFGYEGEMFNLPEIKLCPVPTEKPPIIVGGHADVALKRAARLGDGWVAAGGDFESIEKMVNRIQELRKEYGRDHLPFQLQAMTQEAYSVDGIKRLEDIGITDVVVAFRNVYESEPEKPVPEKIAMMEWYANEVIAKSK